MQLHKVLENWHIPTDTLQHYILTVDLRIYVLPEFTQCEHFHDNTCHNNNTSLSTHCQLYRLYNATYYYKVLLPFQLSQWKIHKQIMLIFRT